MRWLGRSSAAGVALAALLAAGCTLSENVGFDDPVGEVSLVGQVHQGSKAGRTVLFGTARNTGDVEVDNVVAILDAFSSSGARLGQFRGEVTADVQDIEINDNGDLRSVPVTILEMEESGSFTIETPLAFGSVARVEFSAEFTTGEFRPVLEGQ